MRVAALFVMIKRFTECEANRIQCIDSGDNNPERPEYLVKSLGK